MGLSLKLLGGFELRDGGGAELPLRTRKIRALLAYLAVNADKPQPRERLMSLLWSDRSERQARQSLNQALVAIRRLGEDEGIRLIDSNGERVTMRGNAISADVEQMRSLVADDPVKAAALYEGPFLDGLSILDPAFGEWLCATRSEFETLAVATLEQAAERTEGRGDVGEAITLARHLVALDPLREDAHRRLMRLLHRAGDRAGALRQFQACKDILKRELQTDPDAASQALFAKIRAADTTTNAETSMLATQEALVLPDKPSIAVLAFDNMSEDPEQQFFGEGMAEDIITALSRFRSLFVIARNSSFTFKGRSVTVRDVARELGVRYVVEGSVRKAGNRMRVTAQLIDAISGINLWADRFDGHLDDVFGLQDHITEKIVVAVEPAILAREREHARRKPPENLDAWDLLQRGLSHFYRVNREDRAEAIRYFREAIARDPEFAMPHAYLAFALWASRSVSLKDDEVTKTAAATARASAERAISLDPNEPVAHFALGRLHIFAGEPDLAISEMKSAIAINPNYAFGHHGLGFAYHYAAGQAKRAIPHFDVALRLSPRDPLRWAILMTKSSVLRHLGRFDEAIVAGQQACQIPDSGFLPHAILAASFAEAGRMAEAQMSLEKTIQIQPAFSRSFLRRHLTGMHETSWDSLIGALEKAGLHA